MVVQRLKARVDSLLGEKKTNRMVEKDLVTRYEDLQNQIELLSAMRNVSHVVNDAVEFRSILEEVTRIVSDVTGASEITIFLVTEHSLKLQPAVHRRGDVVVFDEDIKRLRIDRRHVYQALQHRVVLRDKGPNQVNFAIPLIADQESLGVLQAMVPLTGEVEEIAGRMERSEAMLVALTKHISLAIKTPILYNRAVVDGLTSLYTKRHFQHQMANYFNASKRLDKPLSLIMLDIDFFKKINDKYGHLSGDRVLAAIALTISKTIRQYDSAYRYGGEELSVLLPESGVEDALLVAGRIRGKIAAEDFLSDDGKKLNVTVSLGVAAFRPELTDMKELIAEADAALYFAKQNGRNQVACMKDGEYRSIDFKSEQGSTDDAYAGDAAALPGKRTRRRTKAPPS
jgi:diguanylate cyclase (GGDEF)-like protein